MSTPGSNLLTQAMQLIASQSVTYLAFASRTANAIGNYVPTYATPVVAKGSFQPVPRSLMQLLGLDMQRNYVNIFLPQSVVDIKRDVTSDQFQYAGITYQGVSSTPWFSVDGWTQILCVQVPS